MGTKYGAFSRQSGSDRLEKQPTDPATAGRHHHYMRDGTLVQSLWIGRKLSAMERLSIASFLANGHEYHLYVYEEIENTPKGTVLKAADEILPESMIFQYKSHPSHAGFSNFFRYKILLSRGGRWGVTDGVVLRRFAL